MRGKLIICSAPSGSGKTTLVKYLLAQNLNLHFSISATTRLPRGEEEDGKDYYFLSSLEFQEKVQNDEFVEWEEVYKGICYGTLKSEIQNLLEEGKNVIFDVDVKGGLNLKEYYNEKALALFIAPPSVEELKKRLTCRATDDACVIEERIAKAEYELSFKDKFDIVIINEVLQDSEKEIVHIVTEFLSQTAEI